MLLRTRALLLFVPLGLLARVDLASAEPSSAEVQKARELFAQAEKDEAAGNWSAALEKLTRAIQVKDTAGLRFHVATCEENLGRLRAAQDDYVAAEKQAAADHNKEVLAAVADPLAALRARIPTLQVVVPADVPDAEVRLDDRALSSDELRASIAVDPGTHRLEAHAAGRKPFAESLHLGEHDVATITLALPKESRETPAPVAPATASTSRSPDDATREHHASRTGALLATGGAVLLAAGGVGAFLLAGSAQSDGKDACARGDSACDSDKTKVHAWDATALGAWIGAAGLGALATYLWLTPGGESASSRTAHVRIGPGSLDLQGRF